MHLASAVGRVIQVAGVVLFAVGIICFASAQPSEPSADVSPPGIERLTAAQLDQLTAPIALYPDPLLGSVLAAATYPLEVVEAARWIDDPSHAALKGDALATALEPQSWDASVKFVVSFPEVLRMMNSNLEWTEELGDAFLAQQSDVMDAIQRLRARAQASGALASTPQQTVSTAEQEIMIEPVAPEIVYVPAYNPWCVYGAWPRECRTADKRDELASLHSITSSARARNDDGTVTPSNLAVLRLIIISTLVACWTGRSAVFAPLRI